MNKLVQAHWRRALKALAVSRNDLLVSPQDSVSRAYYAAFHAVSALFAMEGRTHRKHSALEAAVHRDLVRPGRWPAELGDAFSDVARFRIKGDYDVLTDVGASDAQECFEKAARIVQAVREAIPDLPPS